ncbi:sirohydrochlorin chelatase [Tessaracoccus coleopterorum]|uniref:sirohydrochlorin chelatase n=1 Tax=Tessaracoccus coleopterorum TaxID=2714950 RepID=UPI001E594037|nr:CbiX/SirB N-terminal domain-containing protein [Tessaracoccus coleopterorum]
MPDIVLIAHGSPDPRHARDVEALTDAVRSRVRAGRAVGTCYLDHHEPSADTLALELSGRAVAVPLLLTPAYHSRVDVPQAVERLRVGGADVRLAPTLGPDQRLLDACIELLAADGQQADPDTAVVLFAAGSSDSAAVATVSETIDSAPRQGWGTWDVAALDGGQAVEDVVARLQRGHERVLAVSFMVAEGILRDRMDDRCASLGVRMVPGALARTSVLADLVVARTLG